ncbi:MAG: flagellar hook-basal body complex protein FliE [Oscillospiraceae bacterium]|nr:flagellar hook-basal body complex protein FliE [Oscillospiraceae bacterium]
MALIPLQSHDTLVRLDRMSRMHTMIPMGATQLPVENVDVSKASFLDIFKGMVNNVIETNEQVDRDAIDLMLGNIDDLATVQANIEKANTAVDVLVTFKNEVLSAYNSIINMQI